MIERITDLPDGIFGVRAMGTLTTDEYVSVIGPFVNDLRRHRKRVRCLVEVGPGFTVWVPRTLTWPLISAFEPARPTSQPPITLWVPRTLSQLLTSAIAADGV